MPLLSKPSSAARTALIYITVGAVMDIWTAVWFAYLRNHTPGEDLRYYWCAGFFITGLVLVILGLAVGQIGRAARHAELPPPEVTPAAVNAEQEAAARAPIVTPNPAVPVNPAAVPPVAGVPVAPVATPVAPVQNTPAVKIIKRQQATPYTHA